MATGVIDHSQACYPIDGVYPHLFAVRDLGSARQLAWHPCQSEGANEVLMVLKDLINRHGAPLVLKSDNGSAFIAKRMRNLLERHEIEHLRSPPRTPSYNGALERSNGVLKVYTKLHASRAGHPLRWTVEDLEGARSLHNHISRPWGVDGPTSNKAWRCRDPIRLQERSRFKLILAASRDHYRKTLDIPVDAQGKVAADDRKRTPNYMLTPAIT